MKTSPVAIGGIGGSGTRVVASILQQLGYYIGSDVNTAHDNVWFTLLFKRPQILGDADAFKNALSIFLKAMTKSDALTPRESGWLAGLAAERRVEPGRWLAQRIVTLQARLEGDAQPPPLWGWKEPNTHVMFDQLQGALPGLKYIHVVRNGLDMAYSDNRNQLALWGNVFLADASSELTPARALRYWCVMQQRISRLSGGMNGSFLSVSYERFCAQPEASIHALARFLGTEVSSAQAQELARQVKPATIGRYKQHGLRDLDQADVAYVASLGFDTSI